MREPFKITSIASGGFYSCDKKFTIGYPQKKQFGFI